MLQRFALGLACLLAPAVAAQPDLSISATAEDASGDAGDRVTLDYTAFLTGAEEIEDVPVGFYFSTDQTLSSDDTFSEREEVDTESDEPESDNEQIDIPASLADGDYFILVVIDDLDLVAESNENNNTEAIPFTVGSGNTGGGGGADLVITSVSAEPASGDSGDEIEGEYALANTGSEQAGESSVAFYLSTNASLSSNDTFLTREDADEVDADGDGDGDFEFTVPSSLAAGDYFLLAVADDRNDVTETNESNNVTATPFTVTSDGGGTGGGEADLEITTASVSPTSADAGSEVEVSYTLANTGSADAGETQVGVYVSTDPNLSSNDVLVTRTDGDDVEAGESEDSDEDVTVPNSLAPGDYFVLFVADDRNTVSESDESNNTVAVPFTVTGDGDGGGDGQADLRVAELSTERPGGAPGPATQGTYTLANVGSGEAGASTVAFYLSTDNSFSSSDTFLAIDAVGALEADGSASDTFEFNIPPFTEAGQYFILAVADDGNDVTEASESNNVGATPFRVIERRRRPTARAAADVTAKSGETLGEGEIRLGTATPNPSADRATVQFALGTAGPARLSVVDALGREVAVLADGSHAEGSHSATWDAARLAPGLYVLRLDAAGKVEVRTVTVAR